jgi:hypothetical protein
MSRSVVGGGKGGSSAYDPQIGASSAQIARTAQQAEDFAENYYKTVVTPLLQQQNTASIEAQGKLNNLYDQNYEQTKLAMDRYKANGIPAEDRYYQMVSKYSEPEEMERQAQAAKGDLETAAEGQRSNMMRQFAGLGIDPTSPAAQSAMADMAVQNTAAQAGAMNRARNAARTLGLQLTSDAANFGRGGTSQALAFGNSASGNATGAFGIANQALNTGMQAGNSVNQGYNTAMSGYNNIMDNYTKMGTADLQAQSAGGFGALVGQLGSAAINKMKFSDRRLKFNVHVVGKLPSGLNVYEFQYVWGGERQIGVMAQEVQHVIPEAVSVAPNGYLMVDYGMVR